MRKILDRLSFFNKKTEEVNDHGVVTNENRDWEKSYRQRWQHDKIVRSTHGANCTGSCSWKIYVKNGLITWETQQTDYPCTRPDLPNHEPRGCQRGASYSWYIYSNARLKYPLVRTTLIRAWRSIKKDINDPVEVWKKIVNDKEIVKSYQSIRGLGGFVRADWEEVSDIIAAANIYTIKKYGPDRVVGFSPIPAMSMISYAAGSRYLSLIGGACLSFYDWYCDLPPSSPQTWGEQTDVPESADWYNSNFIILWGSNVPQTRTPDAHFFTEVRYKGAKTVVVTPDYSEASKLSDVWLAPKPGTDSALAMAMGHVILKEFYLDKNTRSHYFLSYAKQYTDMPFLVILEKNNDGYNAGRFLRSVDFDDNLETHDNFEWKCVVFDKKKNKYVVPNGTVGDRWNKSAKWNLELKDSKDNSEISPLLSFFDNYDDVASVGFPYFGAKDHKHDYFNHTNHKNVLFRNLPVKKLLLKNKEYFVTTVFDLLVSNYGIDRGLGGDNVANNYNIDVPYTPKWQEIITGVKSESVITIAQQFAQNAHDTEGQSMIIVGAAMNHWYHMDMNYRSLINMLVFCGCVGKSGGGWAHYVGQEKLRPQGGWLPLAFGLDWSKPPRHMNGTSFFYNHSSQWRHEKISVAEITSPLNKNKSCEELTLIDYNAKSERLGWLPSAPQLEENPINLSKGFDKDKDIITNIVNRLKNNTLKMSCDDPDHINNTPKNLFVWRSNILGSSGKGHEYFLKYLLGTQHGIKENNVGIKPKEVKYRDVPIEGKLDLLVTLDFRMSTTCLYSDIVLPTASWYEKDDLNTSDMHPFIHPLSAAIDPVWETKSDWNIYKLIANKFQKLVVGHLGVEKDVVLVPLLHDTPSEMGQSLDVKDWKYGECDAIPGKTMPNMVVVERNYEEIYDKFVSLGPLLENSGNFVKGIAWDTKEEVEFLKKLNGIYHNDKISNNRVKIDTAIDAAEVVLTLAPETNGRVAYKTWKSLEKTTGREHMHLVLGKEHEKIRFRDLQSQPRKIITSPTWSGIESEEVSYNSGYTNVYELIPWRTLTGRQQLYQDHSWMRLFGEELCVYKPPIDTKTITNVAHKSNKRVNNKQVVLNFITPHQKWGIHSTYTDNLLMLTLSRGGPIVWISENDANVISAVDNDWVEAYNLNGALTARVIVSQRVPDGMILMYHAQEKIVNVPVSEYTNYRGGIHNSVTRTCPKPTHMIGGYAQQAYGFNYYGTVGSNRDEFIILRKLEKVEWNITKNIVEHDGDKS